MGVTAGGSGNEGVGEWHLFSGAGQTGNDWVPTSITATHNYNACLLYTSPSPRDRTRSRMPSSA